MKNNKILLVILSFLLMFGLSGCASKSNIGVVSYEKIQKESKDYAEITNLREEIGKLEEKLRDKKLVAQEELQAQENQLNEEMQSTWQSRMQVKESEVNQRIQAKNQGFIDEKNKQLQSFIASVEEDTNKELNVLRQEAGQPGVSEERLQELDRQAADIIQKGHDRVGAKQQEIQKEIDAAVAGDQQSAQSELMAYSESVRAELMAEASKKANEYMENLFGEDQKKQNELNSRYVELVKKFDENLKVVIAEVAKGKKLDTVFSKYTVNVKAVDITDDVIKAVNKEKK